jgi:hypothetical protein
MDVVQKSSLYQPKVTSAVTFRTGLIIRFMAFERLSTWREL